VPAIKIRYFSLGIFVALLAFLSQLKIRESFSKRIEDKPDSGLVTSRLIHLKECPVTNIVRTYIQRMRYVKIDVNFVFILPGIDTRLRAEQYRAIGGNRRQH
jgi:hypothetical protein